MSCAQWAWMTFEGCLVVDEFEGSTAIEFKGLPGKRRIVKRQS
jgi:hypothetical protein